MGVKGAEKFFIEDNIVMKTFLTIAGPVLLPEFGGTSSSFAELRKGKGRDVGGDMWCAARLELGTLEYSLLCKPSSPFLPILVQVLLRPGQGPGTRLWGLDGLH